MTRVILSAFFLLLAGGSLVAAEPTQKPNVLQRPADRSEAGSSSAKKAAGLAPDQFDKLRALIKPKPGGFDDVPWMTDLWEARRKAAAEGKPLLVWVGDGHPLGWT